MPYDPFNRQRLPFRSYGPGLGPRSYSGAYADRQSRFEVRTARRYGDWGVLAIPTAALWFEEVELAAAADADVEGSAPAIIDIWS
jgi:hypothetical protein